MNPIPLIDAVNAATREVERAQALHPHWPADPLHAVAILAEELGELTQKLLQATYEPKKQVTIEAIREEAVQVAAMGLRFLVNFHQYQFPAAVGADPVSNQRTLGIYREGGDRSFVEVLSHRQEGEMAWQRLRVLSVLQGSHTVGETFEVSENVTIPSARAWTGWSLETFTIPR